VQDLINAFKNESKQAKAQARETDKKLNEMNEHKTINTKIKKILQSMSKISQINSQCH
jgi:hypothetical protein